MRAEPLRPALVVGSCPEDIDKVRPGATLAAAASLSALLVAPPTAAAAAPSNNRVLDVGGGGDYVSALTAGVSSPRTWRALN